jgi:hypothetical protein
VQRRYFNTYNLGHAHAIAHCWDHRGNHSHVDDLSYRPEHISISCLSYEPAIVTPSGTLVRKIFPGPPNYESVKKGDRHETSWFLDLPESVCVNESKTEPELNPKQSGIHEIQLVLQSEQYQQHKGMVGRKVLATGTLFGEHTGHHHTPVLLTVRALDEPPK